MALWFDVFIGLLIAFAIEELVLLKAVSTIAQSEPLSRRLEQTAIWLPAVGIGLVSATVNPGDMRGGGINALGLMLCIAGLCLRYTARRTLGRFFTIGVVRQEGHRVIQDGPYRYIRHPAYLAFVLFSGGLPLVIGNYWGELLLGLPSLVVFVALFIVEDRYLARLLGEDYRNYQNRTARLIPGLW